MKPKRRGKQDNSKFIFALLALLLVFIVEMIFFGWCRTQYTNFKYKIQEEATRKRNLVAMQDHLKIELRRLKSPRRIARIAREQLGLVMPTPQQTIILPRE